MITLTPQKTINKAYLKLPVIEAQIDTMRKNFDTLKANAVEGESEENYKNLIANFLRDTWYADYQINTSERIDLAIYNSSEAAKGKPAVLIEVKAPQNKGEMCSLEDMNKKAFHESVLYFLREREQNHNNEIKYILITNYNEYFLINAKNFLDNIASDSRVKEIYKKHTSGQLTNDKTSTFYEEIKALNLPANERLEITHFSLQDFENAFAQNDEQTLIALYKLLSPETLLAKPFANDSNSLDTKFYAELLHIIGLEEVSEGGQKIIKRLPQGKRQYASLFEGAMYQLEDKINGEEERSEVAMRLVITWVNRLLFLKLLEAQQLAYQSGDKSYRFLDIGFIRDFDDLGELFFKVLARKTADRHESIADKYSKVPYLNSSLFERTEDEQKFLEISNLKTEELAIFSATVLKEHDGGRRIGKLDTLTYIFEFLDAYNFASDGNSAIQQDKKTLINASVLGLIFEKINGYKDGSFFTPGFITQYMAHEAIERAVVRKFSEAKGWKCQSLIDVKNEIEDRIEAAEIFDTLKICDPAVGSGHFLVSILNELIATKFYLGLLFSPDGFRVNPVDWQITVENDELSIVNENGSIYAYNPKNQNTRFVQEALFNEKRNLIENCLFGADINPNSVNICRLRLWIELLKNAYYTRESGYKELETLPNIDINIKCGNSLISKYPVNDAQGLRGIKKQLVAEYKIKVAEYKSEKDKSTKGEITEIISRIKEQFTEAFQLSLFDQEQNQNRLNNSIYKNGIEWVMEFPEVLDENGRFMGFDVVIGNPPYIQLQANGGELANQLAPQNYQTFARTGDIYALFYERGSQLLADGGHLCFITSNKWMRAGYGEKLRAFLAANTNPQLLIDFAGVKIFDSATVDTNILLFQKAPNTLATRAVTANNLQKADLDHLATYATTHATTCCFNSSDSWVILSPAEAAIKQKIEQRGTPLKDWDININYGIKTGFNDAFIISTETRNQILAACQSPEEQQRTQQLIRPILRGRDIKRYSYQWAELWLINTHNGVKDKGIARIDVEKDFPAVKAHLDAYYDKLAKRADKGETPYNLRNCAYLQEFNKPKIVWASVGETYYSLVPKDMYLLDTNYFFSIDEPDYLLAVLNSKLVTYWINSEDTPIGEGGAYRHYKYNLERLPIPRPTPTQSQHFATLLAKQDYAAIDKAVYELYGLTKEEIEIIEK